MTSEPASGHGAFAHVNGTTLWYDVSGAGSALVFVHGFTLDHRCWDAQTELFARKHRVVEGGKAVWRSVGWFAAALDAQLGRYSGWHWQNTNPQRAPDPPLHERLADVTAPTFVVVGERDLPYNHEIGRRLAGEIPRAELSVIPNAGHLPSMEAAAAFNSTVAAFIDRAERD